MQGRGLGEHAEPLVLDAYLARDQAPAVGAYQVPRADRVVAPAGVVADPGCDPLAVLLQSHQFVMEAHASRRELIGTPAQDRLQADLGQVLLDPRARGAPVLVGSAGAPALKSRDASPVLLGRSREARVVGGG